MSILFSTTILLTACTTPFSSKDETPQTNQQIAKKEEKQKVLVQYIKQQEKKIERLTDEVNYYRNYVKEVSMLLPENERQALINKEWKYSITINNVEFPKNGIMEIKDRNFKIVISEKKAPYSVLPKEESIKGKIPYDLQAAVSMSDNNGIDVSQKVTQHKNEVILTYSFKNVKPNSVIKINISDELAKKLGINTNDLEIHVVE